ncbi:MAG TPA: N(4)-(beta-N-acetylglucosaminyl)-L-asparaginase [Thermoanaerobaculia bacterium]|nr:N(4)-(beta-N-acetylglucosaminyl)-L-asparaginase [Thermoanaerobaculia bacterium]
MDRRRFLQSTAAATGMLALGGCEREGAPAPESATPGGARPPTSPATAAGEPEGRSGTELGGSPPVVVSSANGLRAIERAMDLLRAGEDTLEAVVSGVNLVEEDPEDTSVGYGGLPNEDGVVQLDASVMHGPTRGAGAVAAIEEILHPSRVAKQVMEHTDHVLLVGRDATRFAVKMGHQTQNLLTPEARERWLEWKRGLSDRDDWIDPAERLPAVAATGPETERDHGTINCNAIDAKGDISGVTTTSGLAWKIAGRVGDSPILGAGLYVDNQVGACGSTGRGEANLKTCASFLAVELMRQGLSPEEAGLRVLQRIAENTVEPYLLDEQGRPNFQVNFYLLDKRGRFAGVAMWSGASFAAHDGQANRLYASAYLYRRPERPS